MRPKPLFFVQVGHVQIPVFVVETLVLDNQEAWGCYDNDERSIMLERGAVESDRRVEIFVHELVHATKHIMKTDFREEENVCWHIGSMISQVLAQAPARKFLLGGKLK